MTVDRTSAWRGVAGAAALVVAVAAVLSLVLGIGATDYTVHARFSDAGQLIRGARVEVAGREVGNINRITLTRDGLADVELRIDDERLVPLREGTRAQIRAVGQASLANRYVDVSPGARGARALKAGAVLPLSQTRGIVDVDAFFSEMGPSTRKDVQHLIKHGSEMFSGSTAPTFNRLLRRLNPALIEFSRFTADLADDRAQLARLLTASAAAASAVGSRSRDLEKVVDNVARSFHAVSTERAALTSVLRRAPSVLGRASNTLQLIASTADVMRPTLREIPATARPLAQVVKIGAPALRRSAPVAATLRAQVPGLRKSLAGLQPLEAPTVRALRSTAVGMKDATPVFSGLRQYGADFVLGLFNGLLGLASGPYSGYGHYMRVNFVQAPETFIGGIGSQLLTSAPVPGSPLAVRTKAVRRCPGSNAPPAPDGSNPWLLGSKLCDASMSLTDEVNRP